MGRSRGDDDGAALVEFALVLPLLTLFLFGIVQFGLAYDQKQSINSAAREGARLGALPTTTMEEIARRSIAAFDASVASGGDPTIEVRDSSGDVIGTRNASGSYSIVVPPSHPGPPPDQEDDETLMPCGRSSPSDFVNVTVSAPFELTIPFYGAPTITLQAEGEFRCE